MGINNIHNAVTLRKSELTVIVWEIVNMTDNSILSGVRSPADLKKLSAEELDILAGEIRSEIIDTVSENGGHLASNLGVVELTIAIHTVFDLPNDKVVWDVGHQSYAHKILTGRCDVLNTIRTENGISGFPKRSESKYDAFDTGHSSTSVSAAFGIACADSLNNEKNYTIAVIGDGALTGGLAFEGLNCAGRSKERLIVILNDNKMSISKNVGSMARYLTKIRIQPSYIRAKSRVHRKLDRFNGVGRAITNTIRNIKNWIKINLLGNRKTMFEQLGFNYYGPLNGHDIQQLQSALKAARYSKGAVLLHVCTVKGKGYEFAEKNPKNYHGISAFDMETGEPKSSSKGYSDVFGEVICRAAENDKRICAITAAMAMGTGLSDFSKKYKNRFFDVGIAEEHAVTFASGLAAGGMIPVFAVYSTFLQRSYDQILHDAALQKLHIVLAIDRAGIVGEDGETHQGIFDIAFLGTIPNVTMFAPSSFYELQKMLLCAIYDTECIAAVRYPRGGELYIPEKYKYDGEDYSFYGNKKAAVLIVTFGRIFSNACTALEHLEKNGKDVCILKLNKIMPINENAVYEAMNFDDVYFFEEGIKNGGIGERFAFLMYQKGFRKNIQLVAIDNFVKQAKVDSALAKLGLDAEGIERTVSDGSCRYTVEH